MTQSLLQQHRLDMELDYRKLPLYLRGFAISDSRLRSVPSNFRHLQKDGVHIYIEHLTNYYSSNSGNSSIHIFGVVVDTLYPESAPQQVANYLASLLEKGRDKFLQKLYSIGGRYGIFAKHGSASFLLGDAGGVRSLFYTRFKDGFLVGSHARLLAKQIGAAVNPITTKLQDFGMENYRARNWPGRQSRYEGVYQITANTLLNLPSMSVERFFPFDRLPHRTSREAAEISSVYIKNASDSFMRHYRSKEQHPALLLLTSGIDSRLILSSMKDHTDKISTLTYRVSAANDGDMKMAEKLARLIGVEHHSFIAHRESIPGVTKWSVDNSACVYLGNRSVIDNCARAFSQHGCSLRGNLGEISRGVFLARRAFTDNPVKFMTRIWYRGAEKHKQILNIFGDYANTVEIEKAQWPLRILYYWEHRHATWHAATANIMDSAFDTFNVLNSRNIIETMCGVSDEDQAAGKVHRAIISILWPELLDLPINPHKGK